MVQYAIKSYMYHQGKLHIETKPLSQVLAEYFLTLVFCCAAVLLCVFWCILCFNLRNITSNLLVTNVVKCNFFLFY